MTQRTVKDSMGELEIPENAKYGAQTQRAINNFPISGIPLPSKFIHSLALIKKIAAQANLQLQLLAAPIVTRIEIATDGIIQGQYDDQFPIDVFQTGSGTSTNMNLNEVIATLASTEAITVHSNDHVNMGQSSNDIIPTGIHVSCATLLQTTLLPALNALAISIENRAGELDAIVKTGRTHLMDAMPIRIGQELSGWAQQIRQGIDRLESMQPRLNQLALGGTAVGTGINAHPEFASLFCQLLAEKTSIPFTPAINYFSALSGQETSVELSGHLKTIAVSLMKISNDLRWMNSGPLSGLSEIELMALQPGSSIMPGKINPVIPEAVTMVCAQVMGNDTTITIAGQSGNFQLNVMLPIIAYNLLQSIELISNASQVLAEKAIQPFTVNESHLQQQLAKNPIIVTALNPVIGYEKGAIIAKQAYKEKRSVIDVAMEHCDLSKEQLETLLDPLDLTQGGIQK